MWWWLAVAHAESMTTESLEWKRVDSDAVARGVVRAVEPAAHGERVTLDVRDAIAGSPPATVTWEWQPATGEALTGREGHEVVIFLSATGGWGPRNHTHPVIDLAAPTAWDAATADCRVLRDRDAILGHLKRVAAELPAVGPASNPETWSWWNPRSTRHECDFGTEVQAALYAGSDVSVVVPALGSVVE